MTIILHDWMLQVCFMASVIDLQSSPPQVSSFSLQCAVTTLALSAAILPNSIMDEAKSKLTKRQEVENNLAHYLKIAQSVIVDTKLTNDPSQDNFIKCESHLIV